MGRVALPRLRITLRLGHRKPIFRGARYAAFLPYDRLSDDKPGRRRRISTSLADHPFLADCPLGLFPLASRTGRNPAQSSTIRPNLARLARTGRYSRTGQAPGRQHDGMQLGLFALDQRGVGGTPVCRSHSAHRQRLYSHTAKLTLKAAFLP
jgi:hypothetical protein